MSYSDGLKKCRPRRPSWESGGCPFIAAFAGSKYYTSAQGIHRLGNHRVQTASFLPRGPRHSSPSLQCKLTDTSDAMFKVHLSLWPKRFLDCLHPQTTSAAADIFRTLRTAFKKSATGVANPIPMLTAKKRPLLGSISPGTTALPDVHAERRHRQVQRPARNVRPKFKCVRVQCGVRAGLRGRRHPAERCYPQQQCGRCEVRALRYGTSLGQRRRRPLLLFNVPSGLHGCRQRDQKPHLGRGK